MARYNKFSGDDDRPEFNQAALFITRLDEMSGLINECLRVNDLNGASLLVGQMFVMIEYRIKMADNKELFGKTYQGYRLEIEERLKKINNFLSGDSNVLKMNVKILRTELKEICRLIYWLQWDMNFIFPEKIKKFWQDEVKSDFS